MSEPSEEVKSTKLNPMLLVCYVFIPTIWAATQAILIPYVPHLMCLVTAILYVACHWSLVLREEPEEGETGSRTSSERETLRKEDAMQFPIIGSLSLFALYLAFKFLDKELVNLIIGGYFAVVGCLALTFTIAPAVAAIAKYIGISLERRIKWGVQINHPLPTSVAGESPWDIGIDLSIAEIISSVGSAVFCAFYFKYKSWPMNNVLGICFCLQGIERFSLGTYKIGAILLVGLFFYDIFWVFGTDVMVTVAKSLDGPIKILFPRSLTPNEETGKIDLSLLGLGDIVIPGFFLALLLRFDAHKASVSTAVPVDVHASFPKPYFHASLAGYILGLGTTLFVMIQFNAAQPALLYLVPMCLGSSLLVALCHGEMKELFEYSEEEEEEEEEDEKETKDKDADAKKDD